MSPDYRLRRWTAIARGPDTGALGKPYYLAKSMLQPLALLESTEPAAEAPPFGRRFEYFASVELNGIEPSAS